MAPLFRPRSTIWFRAVLIGIPVLLLGALGASVAWKLSDYETDLYQTVEQPVPFSHKHHAGGLGIDCRYCHTTVEKAAFAGIPSTHTCMTCHSQIWTEASMLEPVRESQRTGVPLQWNRVHRLPQFVYFHHGAHVANGVKCIECHGAVETMPLIHKARTFTMRDCLDCHRKKEKELGAQASYGPNRPTGRLTSCNTCHR